MGNLPKGIALDFDGVIHRYSQGWHDGTAYDRPMDGAFDAMRKLRSRGYQVHIFSTRPKEQIVAWFEQYWPREMNLDPVCLYDGIWEKPPALFVVDDRAIRFVNWRDVLNYAV